MDPYNWQPCTILKSRIRLRGDMENPKSVLKDWRILVLIATLIIAFLAIEPNFGIGGAEIIYLSPYSLLGNLSANGATTLGVGSVITSINGLSTQNAQQFYSVLNRTALPNSTITISYSNQIFPYIFVPQQVKVPVSGAAPINSTYIQVQDVPSSNLNYGLDIIGGTQILLAPNSTHYNSTDISQIQTILNARLNTYGISGISVNSIQTVSGSSFVQVSMPSVSEAEAFSLVNNQGSFYAQINNVTVINNSNPNEGILNVCLTSSCPYGGLQPPTQSNGGYQFDFGIQISKLAAETFANATKTIPIVNGYLKHPILLFLNNKQVSSLQVNSNLKGQVQQVIQIQGYGATYQQAYNNMKTLQAILESGSLPIAVKIVSINSVSPVEGTQFIGQIYILLLSAFVVTSIVIFLRYRNYKISAMILMTSAAEIFVVIGLAALIHWTLDIPSIAGIIASVGISVDDQIIITDEIRRGSTIAEGASVKKRIQRAFFIITVSFLSFAAIMFPLFFSTASLFTGFALTTILASLVGLLITRPAYAKMVGVALS